MGQKTHPIGFRLGIVQPWRSRWFATKDMPALLKEDELIRKYLKARLGHAAIADIHVERKPGKVTVTVHTGRPGVVIGKRGAEVDKLRDELAQLTGKEAAINVEEIKRPEVASQLVADNIAHQLVLGDFDDDGGHRNILLFHHLQQPRVAAVIEQVQQRRCAQIDEQAAARRLPHECHDGAARALKLQFELHALQARGGEQSTVVA